MNFDQYSYVFKDQRLSMRAKGLFVYLDTVMDHDFDIQELMDQTRDTLKMLVAGLKELTDAGYVYRKRDERTIGIRYFTFRKPVSKKQALIYIQNYIEDHTANDFDKILLGEVHEKRRKSTKRVCISDAEREIRYGNGT